MSKTRTIRDFDTDNFDNLSAHELDFLRRRIFAGAEMKTTIKRFLDDHANKPCSHTPKLRQAMEDWLNVPNDNAWMAAIELRESLKGLRNKTLVIERRSDGTNDSGAVFDEEHHYRYLLWRTWNRSVTGNRILGFVMLNPSTADAMEDDPTIRRCIGFAKSNGFDGILVANVFALRATNPDELCVHENPVGEGNTLALRAMAQFSHEVIAAWGTNKALKLDDQGNFAGNVLLSELLPSQKRLLCLGRTSNGSPRHPLYIRADTKPEVWA